MREAGRWEMGRGRWWAGVRGSGGVKGGRRGLGEVGEKKRSEPNISK